jgi:hypothetical protein
LDWVKQNQHSCNNHDPISVFRRKLIAEGILTEDSAAAATMNPSWATTSYGLFAVDGAACLPSLFWR